MSCSKQRNSTCLNHFRKQPKLHYRACFVGASGYHHLIQWLAPVSRNRTISPQKPQRNCLHHYGSQYGESECDGNPHARDQLGYDEKEDGEGEGTGDDATQDAPYSDCSLERVGEGSNDAGEEGEGREQTAQARAEEGGAPGECQDEEGRD